MDKTPIIEPGQGGQSPVMTWGELAGTPVHINVEDAKDIPSGPQYRVPAIPKRELVMRRMTKRAADRYD